jgi:hypothetical protein
VVSSRSKRSERIEAQIATINLISKEFSIPAYGTLHWRLPRKDDDRLSAFEQHSWEPPHATEIILHAGFLVRRLYAVYTLFEANYRHETGKFHTDNGFRRGNLIPFNWRRFFEAAFASHLAPRISKKIAKAVEDFAQKPENSPFCFTVNQKFYFDTNDEFDDCPNIVTYLPDSSTADDTMVEAFPFDGFDLATVISDDTLDT